MTSQRQTDLLVLASHLVRGVHESTVRQRCDACDIEFADVAARAAVMRIDTIDARPSGEADEVRLDSGVFVPSKPTARAFWQLDLSKARAWLGAERFTELKDEGHTDSNSCLASQHSAKQTLIAAISEAYPDMADQAATESWAWLLSQYKALPNPEHESKTDMKDSNVDKEYQAAKARANSAIANAWRDTPTRARLDQLAMDEDTDPDDVDDDNDEPTGNVHERAMEAWDALRAKAAAGRLTSSDARQMGRLAQAIADAAEASTVEKTDAKDADGEYAQQRERAKARVHNAWRA
ncbi:MAG: hypothetical protein ABI548_04640 [Polyangiaceae bacterium]